MTRFPFKKSITLLAAIPFVLLLLEVGIRVAAPQPVDEVNFEDIYTESYSPTLKRNIMSLVPSTTRIKNGKRVHINSRGNRDHEYSYEKHQGVKRIAIVGSSVTFGLNLDLKETFGKRLETTLNQYSQDERYEVLLFGRPGFKARESYARVADEMLNYSPDLIIYSFVQNNYEDQTPEDYFSGKSVTASNDQGENKTPSLLRRLRNSWQTTKQHPVMREVRESFHLYLFSVNSLARILRELSPSEKEQGQNIAPLYPDDTVFRKKITNTESWINLMHQACLVRDVNFAVLIHPYEMQLSVDGMNKWRSRGLPVPHNATEFKTYERMKSYAENMGISFLDILPGIRDDMTKASNYYLDNDYGHYNSEGNQILAAHLSTMIPSLVD